MSRVPSSVRRLRHALPCCALVVSGLTSIALAGGANSVDHILPPDTMFVVSVDDDEAYTKSLEGMPFNKIMKEEEVVAFLEKPRAAIKDALAELTAKLKEQEGFENFDLSPEKLFSGNYGRMFVAITHVGLPSPEAGSPIPDIGFVVGIERREGAPDWQALLKDIVGRLTAKMPPEMAVHFEKVEKDGMNYEELMGGPPMRPAVVMGTVGNLQLFSLSKNSLAAVMSRASGNAQGKNLADNAIYQRCTKSIGMDSPSTVHFFANLDGAFKVATEGIKLALQQENQTEYIPTVDRIFELSGLKALKGISTASEAVDGVAHSRVFSLIDGERKGLLAAMPCEPIDLKNLKMVPKDATSLTMSQFNLGAVYDFAMNVFKEVDEKEYASAMEQLKGFQQMIGGQEKPLDIRADLIGNLGPQFMLVAPPSSNPMMPSYLAMLEVRNPDVAVDALTKVINFGATQSGGEVGLKTSDYKGTTIHQIEINGNLPIQLSPCFAVKDKFLMFALSTGDLKKQLRNAEKAESDITQKEDFQRFWGKVPQDGLVSLSYSDMKYAVESSYGGITMALPMLSMAGDMDLPIDMNLLPQQEALTKHLFGSLSYGVHTKDGELMESYGPFGGEVASALISGGIGVGALVAVRAAKEGMGHSSPAHAEAEPPKPVELQPADTAHNDLVNLKVGVTIYKLQHDQNAPDRLEQILEPMPDYKEGALGTDKLPIDPWGHAYLYKKTETGFVIWSMGPDGKDDGGSGDDIAVRK